MGPLGYARNRVTLISLFSANIATFAVYSCVRACLCSYLGPLGASGPLSQIGGSGDWVRVSCLVIACQTCCFCVPHA